MRRESGSRDFPIWLIGDSSPSHWEGDLADPLDSRHPARHNIWTPILEGIQSQLFSSMRTRLNTDELYIRNAVHHASEKPGDKAVEWSARVEEEIEELISLLASHTPRLVFSFGAFAFEFTRRSRDEVPNRAFGYWTTTRLGREFRKRIRAFTADSINLVPLLHVSIARRHFLTSHANFTQSEEGNYFEHVVAEIGDCLSRNLTEFPFLR